MTDEKQELNLEAITSVVPLPKGSEGPFQIIGDTYDWYISVRSAVKAGDLQEEAVKCALEWYQQTAEMYKDWGGG